MCEGATESFEWLNTFIGQKQTADVKSTADLLEAVKSVFAEVGAWEKQRSFASDGAHKMSSNRTFEGVNAAGVKGNSFTSHLQRKLDLELPGRNPLKFHCTLHILNLAIGDVITTVLRTEWIPFLRGVYSYFSSSPKRTETFFKLGSTKSDSLEKHFTNLRNDETSYAPKVMLKFKLYCSTRWLGIFNCTEALVRSWLILEEYLEILIEDGFGAIDAQEDLREFDEQEDFTVTNFEDENEAKIEILKENEYETLRIQACFLKKGTEIQALKGRRYCRAVVQENYGDETYRVFFKSNGRVIDRYPLYGIKPMVFLTCDRCQERKIDAVMDYQCKDCDLDVCDLCINELRSHALRTRNGSEEDGTSNGKPAMSINCLWLHAEILKCKTAEDLGLHTDSVRKCRKQFNILDMNEILENERNAFEDRLLEYVPENKRSILLSRIFGINAVNQGRTFYMHTFLTYYSTLMKRLQTTLQPIQHKAARWLQQFYKQCEMAFIDSSIVEDLWASPYSVFREQQKKEGKLELLYVMDVEARNFAIGVLERMRERLRPYFPYYQAMEIIDPCISDEKFAFTTTGKRREALIDICSRHDIPFAEVIHQVASLRSQVDSFTKEQKIFADQNLLLFYRDLYKSEQPGLTELLRFTRAIFSMPIVTVTIETLFSSMGCNKTFERASLLDETVANILHTHSLKSMIHDEGACLEKNIQLDYDKTFLHRLLPGL